MLDGAAARFLVVVNHEGQFSLWPEDREPPAGWRTDGARGTRTECLDHIREHWDDMRPLSLRRTLGESSA
ncbi:MbtH family protein [Streptomyces sp. NBC_00847]|uniref:MbtH family protein n=1 Tax=unclassified Streptomyces TaxID=2593676 RepID=UPI0022547487|nr:MbtH family protein [Streptomyces sp. NBC_00847]MCX4881512.1 MbtH family protein [Streptomyces sp. NBC_00847]